MTGSRRRLAWIAWLLPAAAAVDAQGLSEEAQACLTEVARSVPGPEADSVLLGALCPALAERLAQGRLGESFQVPPQQLEAARLRHLLRLLETYDRGVPSGPMLATEPLAAIVEELAPFETPPSQTAWQRLLDWLEAWLGTEARGAGWLDWLRDLTLPERWERAFVSAVAAVLVLAGLVAVLAALVAALHGRRRVRLRNRRAEPKQASSQPSELDGLPPARQPIVLFEMIVERLRRRSAARFRDSLTHRELAAAADDLEAGHRRAMAAVADAAERVTFGAWRPLPAEVEPIVREGRALLEALSAERPGSAEAKEQVA